MNVRITAAALVATMGVAVGGIAVGIAAPALAQQDRTQAPGTQAAGTQPGGTQPGGTQAAGPMRQAPESFHALAQAKLPAVVAVTTTSNGDGPRARPGIPGLPPGLPPGFPAIPPELRDRFGLPDGAPPPGPQRALGSGFVIDAEGYVVTNNHVVEDADEITVVLQDKSELEAELVGRDPRTDLALLKVDPRGRRLAAVAWGDSDQALVGDWVLAIGNPFGLGGTVTAGIVSARARDINAGPYDDFIQTDAAINQGNSGGPLFNMAGEVVGVNTAIFSPTGGSVGIGFAIPSEIARDVVAQLREEGRVRRGWLGVQIQPVTPEIAEAVGLERPQGAIVSGLTERGPAGAAGVEPGDVVLSFAGKEIEEVRDLTRAVADAPIGQPAEVVVWREGQRVTLRPTIAQLDESAQQVAGGPGQGQTAPALAEGALGLALAEITPDLRERFGIERSEPGVLVAGVREGSPADRQGFRPGDVITRVGRDAVSEPGEVADALRKAREQNRDSVLILRQRDDNQGFVALPLKDGSN